MPLTDAELDTLRRLHHRLDRSIRGYTENGRRRLGFRVLDRYYDGEQHLEQLGIAVPEDLRRFTTIVAWPGTYIDSIVERCTVEGFRLPGSKTAAEDLWEIWQANDLDTESPMARVDAKVFGRGYYCAGTGDDPDVPLVTVESPLQLIHEWSNRHRAVTSAARFYEDESDGEKTRRATLYEPRQTTWCKRARNGRWVIEERDEHGLGEVPVVPLVNKSRTHDRYGVSQMVRIIKLTDAAARALTNAQVATEVMALPQRFAAGMTGGDFKDPKTGEQLTAWEAYFGAVWATANKEARFGQFQAADLKNFTEIVSHYAQQVAGTTGLPMRFLGQLSDNPPSADGIRADESRLVKTCELSNTAEAGSLERVMRLVTRLRGDDEKALNMLETIHRDPSTPTTAQSADAAVKKHQERLISRKQALRDMGYSPTQITKIEEELAEELAATREDPTLGRITRDLIDASG